jgi:hypothetical protein
MDEKMSSDQQDVLNCWAEHFTELLDGFMIYEMDVNSEKLVGSIEEVDVDVPTQLEINTPIAKLKNNRVSGSSSILAELLKFGGAEMNKGFIKFQARYGVGKCCPMKGTLD